MASAQGITILVWGDRHRSRRKLDAGKSLGGDDGRQEVEDRAKMNAAQYLHIHDDSFMPNPLRELIRCVAVITNESKALEAAENILTWSSDKETVIYRGQFAISMSEFTGSIHSSINAMNKLLRQILGYDDLPPMSLHQIDDDLNNRRRGESFMHNLSNQLTIFEGKWSQCDIRVPRRRKLLREIIYLFSHVKTSRDGWYDMEI